MTSPDLELLYRQARYVIEDGEANFVIRLDDENKEMNAFLHDRGSRMWAFMTAYNPQSMPLSEGENQAAQAELITELSDAGYKFLAGYGTGDDWEPEPSLFVLGIDQEQAVSIARRYGQHAILWGRVDQPAQLVWC